MKTLPAFVLGAGLGTRLRPLTDERPKPLVPLFGKPLLTFAFDHLLQAGASRFVVNTHHCPGAYADLLGERDGLAEYRGREVRFRNEPVLLETGGGIRNVADLLGDSDFWVYNGDVLGDFPLGPVRDRHLAEKNLATLVLRSSGGPAHVQCDTAAGRVTDIRGAIGGREEPAFLFTGISLLSPEIFPHIPAGKVVSIIPIYVDLIRRGYPIGAVVVDEGVWFDLGTQASYLNAHEWLVGRRLSYLGSDWPRAVSPAAMVDPSARLEGFCAIGAGATVGAGAVLRDVVAWENATISPGALLERCVVRNGRSAAGTVKNGVF